MTGITVLTPTLPERGEMLRECVASIAAQTCPPEAHLIAVDFHRKGPGYWFRYLGAQVETEWLCAMGDDDLLYPHHFEVLLRSLEDDPDVDVLWTYCDSSGIHTYTAYNQPFDSNLLKRCNVVAQTALVRREVYELAGGFKDEHQEDWNLWKRIDALGARFRSIPQVTWEYRFHGHNLSWGELDRSA